MTGIDYWQQLQKLRLYSLERRRERYIIIYTWRILEKQVPNISHLEGQGITAMVHIRRGRTCHVPTVNRKAPTQVQNQLRASLAICGPNLFNTLPARIRNLSNCSTDVFKRQLDKFLRTVPDEPQVRGYTAQRSANSNSLLDMIRVVRALRNATQEGGDSDKSTIGGGHPWSPWE